MSVNTWSVSLLCGTGERWFAGWDFAAFNPPLLPLYAGGLQGAGDVSALYRTDSELNVIVRVTDPFSKEVFPPRRNQTDNSWTW